MHQLDFELNSPNSSGDLSEGSEESWEDTVNNRQDDEAVEFSVKVIEALNQKMREHNLKCENKVTLLQLKKVFRRAAGNIFTEVPNLCTTKGQWAMARVNVFLRLLGGDKLPLSGDSSSPAKPVTKASAITEIDATAQWLPEEQDFIHAKEDVEKYHLDYNFKNINDLYLEDYQKLDFEFKN